MGKTIEAFANYKYYYVRGWLYCSIALAVMQTVLLFLISFKSFYDFFSGTGIPMAAWYLIALLTFSVGAVAGPPLLGLWDFRNVVHVENRNQWSTTEVAMTLCREVHELHETIVGDEKK